MKIEEEEGPVRKNPFALKKKTTVRRNRDEVYPERKGLNKPDFLGNSPLDVLFAKLEKILAASLAETLVELLHEKLFQKPVSDLEKARYSVVDRLLDYLVEIQKHAMESKSEDTKNLISISLHDIKTFAKLVNVVIMVGIYPALSAFQIGVPFEKRRLNDFGKPVYKPIPIGAMAPIKTAQTVTERYAPHSALLVLIYTKMFAVFNTESDVRDLLLKGLGYSDFLTVAIALLTVPYFGPDCRAAVAYSAVVSFASTFELYQDYTLLINTGSPSYFKRFVMEKLQALPYSAPKGDGVLTVIEFVLGLRDLEEINIEKLDHAANVLLLKPRSVSTVDYFTSVGTQCYDILVNINRPTICTAVCHFMEKLWVRNARVVQDFFLRRIWDNINPALLDKMVLVGEAALNNNINVLMSVTQRGVTSDLLTAIFDPVIVPLWEYYAFLRSADKPSEVAQNIIVGYLTLVDPDTAFRTLDTVAKNLVVQQNWTFRLGPNLLVEICPAHDTLTSEQRALAFIKRLDANCKLYVEMLKQVDHEAILRVFASVLARWLHDQSDSANLEDENPFVKLVDLRLLESIGGEFSDKLAQSPYETLRLVSSILRYDASVEADSDEQDSDDEDEHETSTEVVSTVLELLSAIILETDPAALDENCRQKLKEIHALLKSRYADLATASALVERIGVLLHGEKPVSDETEAQRRMLARAITNLNDPLVPIRAHGLYILRQLVEERSSVLTVSFVVELHLMQLKDPEPFIYLNVIKGLESLLDWNTKEVLPVLLLVYSDKKADLDERLRIGEVLLRYVQHQDQAFSGENAQLLFNSGLALIRRPENDKYKEDDRLRMSAMSILGVCCSVNPLGIFQSLELALDCAVGILDLETAKDSAIMRRSAIVLIYDLVAGTSNTDKVPFPQQYRQKVLTLLNYAAEQDNDMLVREQARDVLNYIQELVLIALDTSTA